jgi:hypothetical protein
MYQRYEVRCSLSKQIVCYVATLDEYYYRAVKATDIYLEAYDRLTGRITTLENIGKE